MNRREELYSVMSDYVAKLVVGYAKMNELSSSQLYILKVLGTKGDKNCSELAKLLDVSLPAVTSLVNKLVKKGYVRRHTPENNRRVVMLQISQPGLEMLRQSDARFAEIMDEMLQDFPEEELDVLLGYYKRMNGNMKIKQMQD
ncbi:MarR family winged helix-turn-helix transcriptional regulator [Paenibacillus guangzhouensis]|uniref:MarR family winged helix-turn-helix transcriptional regulator n=1 Tax=Paenibacillus guangzhouensis TaxID=1473112 RepID=UPI0012674411|nr:MarR family transcriptional regulator [Paenibacillus guangzhouensis]